MIKNFLGILFFAPAICFAFNMNARVTDLKETSQFMVNLSDPELLAKGKRVWKIQNGNSLIKTCELEIRSHYNKVLAEKSGSVIYTMDQNQAGSFNDFFNTESRDQFSLWLTTDNKDLPFMLLDCFWAVVGNTHEERHFTLQNVAEFIQQPQFFYQPVLAMHSSKTAYEVLPTATLAQVRVDLEFSAQESGNNSFTLHEPRIKDGKVTTTPIKVPLCSVGYYSPQTNSRSYHLVLTSRPMLRVRYLTQSSGLYMISLEDPYRKFSLMISCSFYDNPVQSFSEIKAQLGNVIDIH